MSYDFALEQRCSHEVAFELPTVDSSNGYVFFQRQPASRASVRLYVDGVNVPQFGLYSYATIPFMTAEPYRIVAGQNDLLYIGVGQDVPQFVQLLTGPGVRAAELAADLQRKLPSLSVTAVNKHVVISSRTQYNGAAFVLPDPRWSDRTESLPTTARVLAAFQHLGIVPGRVAAGRKIIPGWGFAQDPTSPILTDQCIRFESPLKNSQPLIQLSYSTTAQNCRRCFGSRIEFDYRVLDGTYERVTQTDLLNQEFDKFLYTKLGSHWKWSWYGSRIMDLIGSKSNASRSMVPAVVTMDVSQAYRTYENIKQQQQQRFPTQQVSDAEMPNSLDSVNVQVSPTDPTVAIVSITVRNRSRVLIPLQRIVGNPSPFYLTDGSGGPPLLARS